MQTFSDTSQFILNQDVVYTCIDDEAVIMGINQDELYGANVVATEILQLLERQAMTIPELAHYILEHYMVEETTCLVDIRAFIEKMLEEKLISMVSLS